MGGKLDTKDFTCTSEYCGVLTRVGSAVTDLAPGDRVVVAAPGHFKAYERVPMWACQKLRTEENFDVCEPLWGEFSRVTDIDKVASTLMVVFVTALYGLQDRACLQPGEVQRLFYCHMCSDFSVECSNPLGFWRRWSRRHSDCEAARGGDLCHRWYS